MGPVWIRIVCLLSLVAAACIPAESARPRSSRAGLYTVGKQGTGVAYRKGLVLGVGVHVIEADTTDPSVALGAMVARGGIGTAEGFGRMVQRVRPAAAITGTFFGTTNQIPTGDLVINGQPVFRGFIGTAVAITRGNIVSFVSTNYRSAALDWSLYDTVIRAGPRLVSGGKVLMTARGEGFRTLPVTQRRARTAIGLTADGRLQFIAVRQGITLWELAKLSKAIGAYHAVAMDGGTSTALYYAGQFVAYPGRRLTNVLLLYHRRDNYEAARSLFAGTAYRPAPPPVAAGAPRAAEAERETGSGFTPAQNLDLPVKPPAPD